MLCGACIHQHTILSYYTGFAQVLWIRPYQQ
jgi:hypothetical protein